MRLLNELSVTILYFFFVQGDGTREGTGDCSCNIGYTSELCDECKDGYYEEIKNETHTVCKGEMFYCGNIALVCKNCLFTKSLSGKTFLVFIALR